MFEFLSFFDATCFEMLSVNVQENRLLISMRTIASQARCPLCQLPSDRIHSRYVRSPADLPCLGKVVRLHIEVCRFFCCNPLCTRKIFTQRLPSLLAPWARRTQRLDQWLSQLGFEVGGQASQRLSQNSSTPISASTALRQIKHTWVPAPSSVRVLGVDDFAFRRGARYGTMLVDLEKHHPIELLADREAETLMQWLQRHPEIEIISRDRAGMYADGARRGAPQATQVADRFHLLQNLSQMLETLLRRLAPAIKAHLPDPPNPSPAPHPGAEPAEHRPPSKRRKQEPKMREQHFEEVHRLFAQGYRINQISREVGLAWGTVHRYLRFQQVPDWKDQPARPSMLDPAHAYLQERFRQGCHNGAQLARELQAQGMAGNEKGVERYLKKWKRKMGLGVQGTEQGTKRRFSSREVGRWVMARQESLSQEEREHIETVGQANEEAKEAIRLVQHFAHLIREQDEAGFAEWMRTAKESQVKEVRGFAQGIMRDEAAVRAALSLSWSNGPVEAHVNRLKVLKRQMYGRAGLELLRQRVVHYREEESGT